MTDSPKLSREDLIIEVCHDLIKRAMSVEATDDYIPDYQEASIDCAKEAAIRDLLVERSQLRTALSAACDFIEQAAGSLSMEPFMHYKDRANTLRKILEPKL